MQEATQEVGTFRVEIQSPSSSHPMTLAQVSKNKTWYIQFSPLFPFSMQLSLNTGTLIQCTKHTYDVSLPLLEAAQGY